MANIHSNMPPYSSTTRPHSRRHVLRQNATRRIYLSLHLSLNLLDSASDAAITLPSPDGNALEQAIESIAAQTHRLLSTLED